MKPIGTACAATLLLLALPAAVQAQDYQYKTNNNTTTIKYTGSGGAVTIPDKINNLPVASIGDAAFRRCTIGEVVMRQCLTVSPTAEERFASTPEVLKEAA